MQLTEHQKIVLTLLDEHPVASAISFVRRELAIKEEDIKKVIDFLVQQKMLEIHKLPDDGWYFQTGTVTKEMIDISLARKYDTPAYHRFWKEIQKTHPEHITTSKTNLERKLKK